MNLYSEFVTHVHHWTDELFSFQTTRSPGFKFQSGQFAMIGLEVEGKPLMRAYSMASSMYDPQLEFFSIKVADGPLTSRLQHIKEGDTVLVNKKTTGTLTLDNLIPGKRLFLLGAGTGLAPFLSIIQDIETYEAYDEIILIHGVRYVRDLAYEDFIVNDLCNNEYLGEMVSEKLSYIPTVTREDYVTKGRITKLLEDLSLNTDDRFMVCGSPSVLKSTQEVLEQRGFKESRRYLGTYAIERAFVE